MRQKREHQGRDAQRAVRREQLLDAAAAVIRREGADVSMEAIAAEAGVTKPILYRHFRDRKGLVEALADRFAASLFDELQAALGRSPDPRETLGTTIDAYLAFVERDPALYRFIVQRVAGEVASGGFSVGAFMRDVGNRVALVLGEQLRAAGADSGGAEPLAHGMVGMVHAAGDWWVERQTMPRARLVEYLTELLWSGLQANQIGATERR